MLIRKVCAPRFAGSFQSAMQFAVVASGVAGVVVWLGVVVGVAGVVGPVGPVAGGAEVVPFVVTTALLALSLPPPVTSSAIANPIAAAAMAARPIWMSLRSTVEDVNCQARGKWVRAAARGSPGAGRPEGRQRSTTAQRSGSRDR